MIKNLNDFIFSKLCTVKSKYEFEGIKSVSVEAKIIGSDSIFYLSLLIQPEYTLNDECDEIVLEVSSRDYSNYNLDISDSKGIIYQKIENVSDVAGISNFIDDAYNLILLILSEISIIDLPKCLLKK
ncbi:hypothetical protein GKR55_03705 [Providencia stuartii]|nr:hypothetical protein [Providencia stuartii]MTB79648.1 hypothetical protein [Providencia stuartii]